MSEENKAAGPLGWLRSAKDKFRAFAYGEEGEPKERPRVGLALAGGYARGIAHLGVLRVLREAGGRSQGHSWALHGFGMLAGSGGRSDELRGGEDWRTRRRTTRQGKERTKMTCRATSQRK